MYWPICYCQYHDDKIDWRLNYGKLASANATTFFSNATTWKYWELISYSFNQLISMYQTFAQRFIQQLPFSYRIFKNVINFTIIHALRWNLLYRRLWIHPFSFPATGNPIPLFNVRHVRKVKHSFYTSPSSLHHLSYLLPHLSRI